MTMKIKQALATPDPPLYNTSKCADVNVHKYVSTNGETLLDIMQGPTARYKLFHKLHPYMIEMLTKHETACHAFCGGLSPHNITIEYANNEITRISMLDDKMVINISKTKQCVTATSNIFTIFYLSSILDKYTAEYEIQEHDVTFPVYLTKVLDANAKDNELAKFLSKNSEVFNTRLQKGENNTFLKIVVEILRGLYLNKKGAVQDVLLAQFNDRYCCALVLLLLEYGKLETGEYRKLQIHSTEYDEVQRAILTILQMPQIGGTERMRMVFSKWVK